MCTNQITSGRFEKCLCKQFKQNRYEECEQGNSADAKICKGNPHNCVKTKYHRATSRSNKQIIDGV